MTENQPGRLPPSPSKSAPRLHRLRTLRQQQNLSVRAVSLRTGLTCSEVRQQENERRDLTIAQLHVWSKVLQTPVEELLVEPGNELSEPIQQRARLLRVAKTAGAILEQAGSAPVRRLAEMLLDQIDELLPDARSVKPWNQVGPRRSPDEEAPIVQRSVADHRLIDADHGCAQ